MMCECGNHCWATLTQGYVTLVSPEDARELEKKWHASLAARDRRPAVRARRAHKGKCNEYLHRTVMRAKEGQVVDHINSDGLDNRRENLRLCSGAQNVLNARARRGKAVPLKGVRRSRDKYEAMITHQKRQHYLGKYATAEEAHQAYVRAANRLHGEFARTE